MPEKSPILESLAEARPSSYADQVYGRILHDILNGIFQPGARLPTENELAERFGVSRPVVREALARLRVDGLVEARRGSGTYVLSRPSQDLPNLADLEDISRFLRYQELRFYVEGQAAALAAERRTEKQLAAILEAHEAFAHEVGRGAFLPESDRRFHLAICEGTGNEFFAKALEGPEVSLTSFMNVSLALTRSGSQARARRVIAEHAEIVEAIRTKDAVWARVAMETHIINARRRMTDGTIDS
ncbi:FadR/GntR family transcriptional regulator [Sinorhizobium meliloti]|uniref:Transcriptional regulator protein n=3 Tax=Rhizobium meliloti TaxID=382 RepID=F7XJ18_SINMM|nr:FadR/GntR family transcriptional regulator [Sinorhizobium meliloti]AEG08837.1 regulatory protein GntR HTH [Sinorhizobium meliloti BL225C]AEH84320.1 putative transcriptional regulator protein [Sinorhizobium meliloti SM11]ARS67831.1 GntR family transcriptional regulator [Sinorhizobium meliloti RU11/001]ASP82045.1 FadR family transcriptional regulator [Sinorhizobium meliloti]KKA12628.1 GntR family transcriptional regulator [Sinorhizobium meliloti]